MKCSLITKIIGTGSLGIATGVLGYASSRGIDNLVTLIDNNKLDQRIRRLVARVLRSTRYIVAICMTTGSYLLVETFRRSPVSARHLYLIYASLGLPTFALYYGWNVWPLETTILEKLSQSVNGSSMQQRRQKITERSSLDGSAYVSVEGEMTEDNVEDEVEWAIERNQVRNSLAKLSKVYAKGTLLSGLSFCLALVGVIGEAS
ncbi:BA75_01101T0 [Komagataella pastoris]|uniref:BA75_01101T0 n=1 Tax=Komagataella pastoris TaxID=4922 RepID=A0A1B2J7N7_PICPA|nr:BA75_01101T0 [Komagataella pastoris]